MLGITRFTPTLDGYTHGTVLAKAIGLNEHYFTDAMYKGTKFNKEVDIKNFNGNWMVKIPARCYALMDKGYTICIIDETLDGIEVVDTFALTRNTTIGFYK
jgi:hypothetical protein